MRREGRVLRSLIACRDNPCALNHEDHSSLRGARSVQDALWDGEALSWVKFNCTVLQVNDEVSIHNVEEFILFIMLVPMELSLYNAEPYQRIIHPA